MELQTAPKQPRVKRAYALTTYELSTLFSLHAALPAIVCCVQMMLECGTAAECALPLALMAVSGCAGGWIAQAFRKARDNADRLLNGLVLWLAGVVLGLCVSQRFIRLFIAPALSMLGMGFSLRQVFRLRVQMADVSSFANQRPCRLPLPVVSIAFCLIKSPWLSALTALLVFAALICTLLFPLTKRHFDMLTKWKAHPENSALQSVLERVVFHPSLKPYGVRFLILVLRPFYRHRLIGVENVRLDDDIPCVFVCNHGEIYGPVVAELFIPFPFRPWVTYEMTDRNAIADRTLNGTLKNQKWLPPAVMRFLMEKLAAPLLARVMRGVDAIPVYHDNPRKLMQTFRETAAAMEAGDNILLFPENPVKEDDGKYLQEGVSEFFTGFTMIGQIYYNRTGLCPQFIPLYANKRKRTISFGQAVRYNSELPANEEKERLCAALRSEMLKMAKQ